MGRRPPGLPAQGPHRPPRPASDDPPIRGARAVLLDRRERARHHGGRARLDVRRLRRRDQGGHAAPRPARRRQGRRGHRRRGDDGRSRLRGAPPGRRPGDADRRRAQRQRHVDRAQRRGALPLLQPRPPQPEALARSRGCRGPAHRASRRHRRGVRTARPAAEGVHQGVLGTGPLLGGARLGVCRCHRWARRPRAQAGAQAGAGRRPAGRRAHRDRQGQGLRGRRGGRPRGHGEVACREAQVDREPRSRAKQAGAPRRPLGSAAVHADLRRRDRGGGAPRSPRRRHHRGDELRDRPERAAEGRARPLLRRRDRRAAGDPVCRGACAPRGEAGRGDLLDVPAASLRPDRPRRLPAEAQRRLRDGSCGPGRRRRPDAPRRLRHRLPTLPAEHRAHGPA